MATRNEKIIILAKALSNEKRLLVLHWLKDPAKHFPKIITSMRGETGVPSNAIAAKLGIREPTATTHLKLLERAGFVKSVRAGHWTLYSRVPDSVDKAIALLVKLN